LQPLEMVNWTAKTRGAGPIDCSISSPGWDSSPPAACAAWRCVESCWYRWCSISPPT